MTTFELDSVRYMAYDKKRKTNPRWQMFVLSECGYLVVLYILLVLYLCHYSILFTDVYMS